MVTRLAGGLEVTGKGWGCTCPEALSGSLPHSAGTRAQPLHPGCPCSQPGPWNTPPLSLAVFPVLLFCHPRTAHPAPTPRPLWVPTGCFSAQGTSCSWGRTGFRALGSPCCAVVCVAVSQPYWVGRGCAAPRPEGPQQEPQPRQRQGGAPGNSRVRLCASSSLGWECLRLAWEASGQRGGLCGVASRGRPCLRRPRRGPSPEQGCLNPLNKARPHPEPLPTFAESLGLRMWGGRPPPGGSVQGPPGSSAWARALQLCHILFSPFRLQTQSR